MKIDDKRQDTLQGSSDDVEILEVVGVSEDGEPDPEPAELEEPDHADIVLDLDADPDPDSDEDGDDAAAPDGPPPAMPVADPAEEVDQLQRLQADYENLRKRVERERIEFERNANSNLVGRLLPVLDNFERALGIEPRSDEESAFYEGLVLIHKQLMRELRREGLEPIEAVGRAFDPLLHDAVATEPSEEPHGAVVEELQRGYLFRDRLLRPASVKVSMNDSGGGDLDPEGDR